MKRSIAVSIALGFIVPSVAPGQQRSIDRLAQRIVTTSVGIKPGEVVVITGGKHTIPLMEAIAIEAQKAGGMVSILLASDKVVRSLNVDVPEQFLTQEPRYFGDWLKRVDVFITLPVASNIKALDAGVPATRLAKLNAAGEYLTPLLDDMRFRELDITYPTTERGASWGIAGATYVAMMWDAIGADYQRIAEQGKALRGMLETAKSVHVTSPSGTDVTFAVEGRQVFVDDGVMTAEKAKGKKFIARDIALPGGTVSIAPLETSATGRVVAPRVQCRFLTMTAVSFEFKDGKMEGLKATKGLPCLTELIAHSSGPTDVIGGFSIGLNPGMKIHEERNAAYYGGGAVAGVVYLFIGDNQLLGGNNKTTGNFGFGFPVKDATVSLDGKTVVDRGKLTF
jgi:aminopeptidase